MSCDIKINSIVFEIEKVSTIYQSSKKETLHKELYIFVGNNLSSSLKNTFDALNKKEKVKESSLKELKKEYPLYYEQWISSFKKKEYATIQFIFHSIYLDDTINDVRKKIFVYISNVKNNKFIVPFDQELWIKNNKKENEIIGVYFQNAQDEKINNSPCVYYQVPTVNKNFRIGPNYRINTSENNMLIQDLLDSINVKTNKIYFTDYHDELSYLKSYYRNNIPESIYQTFLLKHFPFHKKDKKQENNTKIKSIYKEVSDFFQKEENFHQEERKLQIKNYTNKKNKNNSKNSSVLGSCNIINVQIKVNSHFSQKNKKNSLDLYQIFDYLRDKKLDMKTPFIKYGEDLTGIPVSLTSREALQKNRIKKQTLKDWILKDLTKKMNGISLKRHLIDYENEPRYLSLSIKKNNELLILMAFENKNNASLKELSMGILNVREIIKEINKHIIPKKVNEVQYIEPPNVSLTNVITNKNVNPNKELQFSENTEVKFLNIIIPFQKEQSFNFKDLYEFSKKFPSYFFDDSQNRKQSQNFINNLELRYKKISGFTPMSDIIHQIDIFKQDKVPESEIIHFLQEKYEKSKEEANKYIQEWIRKYSTSSSSKIDSHFKLGNKIEINNQNIKVSGVTKIYLIPIIYQFLQTFMYLYFQKNKNKIINSSFVIQPNLNQEVVNFNNFSSFNLLNIPFTMSSNVYEDLDDHNNENNETVNVNMEELREENNQDENVEKNNENNLQKRGILSASNVVSEILLKCNDPILDKGTCKDACADPRYFIRRLQMYDHILFKPQKDKNKKLKGENKQKKEDKDRYSVKCQRKFQPVVMDKDPEKTKNVNQNSYEYAISYTSREQFPRWYICPKIWCPICEIPIAVSDVNSATLQKKGYTIGSEKDKAICATLKCPFGDHRAIVREAHEYSYPGFVSNYTTPEGFCLPCCYKSEQRQKPQYKKCMKINNNINVNKKDDSVYILGKKSPIDNHRYGILPIYLSKLLNTKLTTGYLGYNKGFLKKGIKHEKNRSFLSCMLDIISCYTKSNQLSLDDLVETFIEKLENDNPLFLSLHYGNLEVLFHNKKSKATSMENYISYLRNKEVYMGHQYLWDFLQRENILFPEGANIFIFENDNLICPFGEDLTQFYNLNRKNIIILKSGHYYEPIHYLEGDGKLVSKSCIFDSSMIYVKKIYDISQKGCQNKYEIDWLQVLKKNIEKDKLPFSTQKNEMNYKFSFDIEFILLQLLQAIKDKKLNNDYKPKYQCVDSYNKVFGIVLHNHFYVPIQPSPLFPKFSYEIIADHKKIPRLSFKDNLKIVSQISKHTQLHYFYESKILDFSSKKYIVALVTNTGRIVPILNTSNNDKKLPISSLNYYSDVDESLSQQIKMYDDRVEKINKKNFEDETYNRMRFELSIFIHKNKTYLKKILAIIYDENNSNSNSNSNSSNNNKNINNSNYIINNNRLNENRKKMYKILNEIFKNITSQKKHTIDYDDYHTPNKRVPCFSRNIKKSKVSKVNNSSNSNNEQSILTCEDDPHCVIDKNSCKLYINKYNLLDIYKGVENYNFYISKIMDELLRFKIKREEILNNDINNIINKNYIPENNNKYLLVKTLDAEDIEYRINQIYYDNKGVFIDNRPLIEESTTREYAFDKSYYLLSKNNIINEFKYDELSGYWQKYLKDFKVNTKQNNLLEQVLFAIHTNKNVYKQNKNLNIQDMKNEISQEIIFSIKNKKNKEKNNSEQHILNKYRSFCGSQDLDKLVSLEQLIGFIKNQSYNGCIVDLHYLSKIYSLNIIVLDKRKQKGQNNKKIDYQRFLDKQSNYYLLLYRSQIGTTSLYNLICKNKIYIFHKNQIPSEFMNLMMSLVNKNNNNK